jgi:hypothetical protein
MGQSKTGGYQKLPTMTGEQQAAQSQVLAMIAPYLQQAAAGYQQFLPGGGGGEAISKAAHQRFEQETIPSIMNAYGSNAKSSSALNQALAAGASNLNTDIASQLAQMQLQAAGGLGAIGQGAQQQLNNPAFAYIKRAPSIWERAIGAQVGGLSGAAGGYATTGSPWGAAAGGISGSARGYNG